MIILITGATHTGKTNLAQKLMEKLMIPYVCQDHIKMGLIRCGYTTLTPDAPDKQMTQYLWPVTREMIKTAIENKQNLIIEGCYIPCDWQQDFPEAYRREIRFICLCFSEQYSRQHFPEIQGFAGCIESRIDDEYFTMELVQRENRRFRENCEKAGLRYFLVEEDYEGIIREILREFEEFK